MVRYDDLNFDTFHKCGSHIGSAIPPQLTPLPGEVPALTPFNLSDFLPKLTLRRNCVLLRGHILISLDEAADAQKKDTLGLVNPD